LRGCRLAASDGEIGKVREFYFDDQHWTVHYLVIQTGSWLAEREVLIAPCVVREVDPQSGAIAVALTREQVRTAPPIATDKPVSRQDAERLHAHYNWNLHWGDPGSAPEIMLVPPALAPPPAFAPPPEVSENLPPEVPPGPAEAKGDPHLRSSAVLLSGYTMHAQDGDIGRVKDFIVDDTDWRVRYLVIHTGGLFLSKDVLLAPDWIECISHETAEVFANLSLSAINGAPEYNSAIPIDRVFEQHLHDHYNRKGYWDAVKAARNSSS
jgi:hypothetical protein